MVIIIYYIWYTNSINVPAYDILKSAEIIFC